jgi:DNA-binding transcriptional ArsR family regulator
VKLTWSSLTRWFYRHLASRSKKRWDEIDWALTSPTRLRMMLFLSRHNPATKHDLIDYMIETGQFERRENAIRVANRHLSDMAQAGSVEIQEDRILLKRSRPLVVMEPPGIWLSIGIGAGIIFLGLGYLGRDFYLIIAAAALTIYSIGVVAHLLLRGTPY